MEIPKLPPHNAKARRRFDSTCEAMGIDPLRELLGMLKDPELPKKQRADILMDLMQYGYAKRKAVEVSGEGGGAISITLDMTGKGAIEDKGK